MYHMCVAVIGEPVKVLVVVSNKGPEAFNLTEIGAFLHSPFDYNFYIQNVSIDKRMEYVLFEQVYCNEF